MDNQPLFDLRAQAQGRRRVLQSGPTEETIECRRQERVESTRGASFLPIVRALPPPPPRDFVLIFSASMFVLMGFYMLGTRLQSLWIMFFLLEGSEKPNTGHNPFEAVTNFTFFFGMLF